MTEPVIINAAWNGTIPDETLAECGNGSFNLGSQPNRIDWEVFYDILDMQYGFDMQEHGGRADNAIRRRVRKMVNEGEVS